VVILLTIIGALIPLVLTLTANASRVEAAPTSIQAQAISPDTDWHWINPLPQGNTLTSVSCQANGDCWTVGGQGTILFKQAGSGEWVSQLSTTTSDLASLSCPVAATCYAAGSNSALLKTTNNGQEWLPLPGAPTGPLKDLQCFGGSLCY